MSILKVFMCIYLFLRIDFVNAFNLSEPLEPEYHSYYNMLGKLALPFEGRVGAILHNIDINVAENPHVALQYLNILGSTSDRVMRTASAGSRLLSVHLQLGQEEKAIESFFGIWNSPRYSDDTKSTSLNIVLESRRVSSVISILKTVKKDWRSLVFISDKSLSIAWKYFKNIDGEIESERKFREILAGRYPSSKYSEEAFFETLKRFSCDRKGFTTSLYFLKRFSLTKELNIGTENLILPILTGKIAEDNRSKRLKSREILDFLYENRLYQSVILLLNRKKELRLLEQDFLFRSYLNLGRYREALYILTKMPKSLKRKKRFRLIIGRLGFKENLLKKAMEIPSLGIQDPNYFERFWFLYREGKFKAAVDLFDGCLRNRPCWKLEEEAKVLYWAARVYAILGDMKKSSDLNSRILAEYGMSFYATQIAHHADSLSNFDGNRSRDQRYIEDSVLKDLSEFEKSDVALDYFKDIYQRYPKQRRQMGDMATLAQDYSTGFRIAKIDWQRRTASYQSLLNSFSSRSFWENYYPRAYKTIVNKVAPYVGIDSHLVYSVIRAESFYDKTARSSVGAFGLLQLMPYTSHKISKVNNFGRVGSEHLRKPSVNIKFGLTYLKMLLEFFGESEVLSLAAYNAGPSAVISWLDRCINCDAMEFIESIPYRETRNYVKKIARFRHYYSRIYSELEEPRSLGNLPSQISGGVIF